MEQVIDIKLAVMFQVFVYKLTERAGKVVVITEGQTTKFEAVFPTEGFFESFQLGVE